MSASEIDIMHVLKPKSAFENGPELTTLLQHILDNPQHYEMEPGLRDIENLPTLAANLHLKTASLPILDNLV